METNSSRIYEILTEWMVVERVKTEKRFFGNVKMTIKRRAKKRERERQINLRNCQKAVFASTKKCLQSKPCLKLEIIITIGIKDVRNVFHSCFIANFFAKIKNSFLQKIVSSIDINTVTAFCN
jgi:hypothetical protein